MKNLKNKIALVTGSSRGIGKAIAIELAKRGAKIILHATKDSKEVKKTLKQIIKYSPKSKFYFVRIENYNSVENWAKKIIKEDKKIDILVNNAGITKDRTFYKMNFEEWDQVIKINLYGIFNVTKNLVNVISSNGRIINISSLVGLNGAFGQCNYAASKAGVIGFTKSLAIELARKKITVNALCPGYTSTAMINKIPKKILEENILPNILLRRLAQPQEIAGLVAYLCSSQASYITGQVLKISGGI